MKHINRWKCFCGSTQPQGQSMRCAKIYFKYRSIYASEKIKLIIYKYYYKIFLPHTATDLFWTGLLLGGKLTVSVVVVFEFSTLRWMFFILYNNSFRVYLTATLRTTHARILMLICGCFFVSNSYYSVCKSFISVEFIHHNII